MLPRSRLRGRTAAVRSTAARLSSVFVVSPLQPMLGWPTCPTIAGPQQMLTSGTHPTKRGQLCSTFKHPGGLQHPASGSRFKRGSCPDAAPFATSSFRPVSCSRSNVDPYISGAPQPCPTPPETNRRGGTGQWHVPGSTETSKGIHTVNAPIRPSTPTVALAVVIFMVTAGVVVALTTGAAGLTPFAAIVGGAVTIAVALLSASRR